MARIEKLVIRQIIRKIKDKGKIEAFLILDRIARIGIIILGIILALAVAGVNFMALLAGAGIFGFILDFVLKDLLSNFLAGLVILIQRPIKIGDFIEIEGKYGLVKLVLIFVIQFY